MKILTKPRWSESNSLIADMLKVQNQHTFTVHRAWIPTSLPNIAWVSLECCCQSNRIVCKMLHVYCFYVILNGLKYAGLQRLDLIGISTFCLKWSQIAYLSIFIKDILIQENRRSMSSSNRTIRCRKFNFCKNGQDGVLRCWKGTKLHWAIVEKELHFCEGSTEYSIIVKQTYNFRLFLYLQFCCHIVKTTLSASRLAI